MKPAFLLFAITALGIGIGSLGVVVMIGNHNDGAGKTSSTALDFDLVRGGGYDYEPDQSEFNRQEEPPDLDEDELKALAFRAIDDTAAHPFDPQNATDVEGLTDDELAAVPQEEIARLIEFSLPYAKENTAEPRYLFALGRAAFIHGDEEFATELLTEASKRGSAAAEAYLGRMIEDPNQAEVHLRRAVAGGFTPAEAWLAEAEAASAEEQVQPPAVRQAVVVSSDIDFTRFNRPDLIRAFYTGETEGLRNEFLNNLTYASGIHNFLSDTTSVLFVAENREIITEVDPKLSYAISRKLLTTQQGMDASINAGVKSFLAPLMAIAHTRQNGGSVQDEVMASNTASMNSPYVKLGVIKEQADQDAKRLAILYDSNPEAFRRIYAGIKKFVLEL